VPQRSGALMWELDKKSNRQSSDAATAASSRMAPGKSTLTSQLPVVRATVAPNHDVDQPAPDDVKQVAGANNSLPRLDLAKATTQSPPGEGAPQPGPGGTEHGGTAVDADAPPAEQYVIPFDHAPRSVPGEQIIFGATYTHATPNNFKLVYTSAGGHFDSQGSGVSTKTFPGLNQRNVDWFIDAHWNGTTAVTMKLEVQKTDGTVLVTKNWTFSKKAYQPTTIAQQEGEGERDNPAVYNYKVGPSRNTGHDDYIGFTVLETFGSYRSNLRVADIKPAYATANGLDSDAKIAAHFFPGSSNHGTFTVSAGDMMADQHGGMAGGDEAKAQLAAPKQVEKILDQTYESDPGTALGRYTITRILKSDGSKKVTKKKI
jgi:hypothetical protein